MNFIGTFFLVFTVGNTVRAGSGAPGSHCNRINPYGDDFRRRAHFGGHFNPAVTLAVWMRGKCPTSDVPAYMIAQVAAGLVAAFLVLFMKGDAKISAMAFERGAIVPLLAEFLGTFALALSS